MERIQRIEILAQRGRAVFMQSFEVQDAVIRSFEVIGEATKRLSQELKDANADIPWRRIAGFRDVLIHEYMSLVLGEIWQVIENDLPNLKQRINQILQDMESANNQHE